MLILDFDGTITDAEREGVPFRAGYLQDLAILTGQSSEEIFALADEFEQGIGADPVSHGWQYEGKIVAPASVDPYLRMMPVAHQIFDRFGVFQSPVERNRIIEVLFLYNYRKTDIVFRDGAKELFSDLENETVRVVTNSDTEAVQNKIRHLSSGTSLHWLENQVYGNAQKYAIDESFTDVDATLQISGLHRQVLLRRRKYHDVIQSLLDEKQADWSELTVIGDIFELDLALPLAKGARVGLMVNEHTPLYERTYVGNHPRGTLLHKLDDIRHLVS